MTERKKPTIRTIAEYVGVSPATVSYALRGKGVLSEATRQKVLEAARTLGYPLTDDRTDPRLIGVIFPRHLQKDEAFHRHEIYGAYTQGIEEVIRSVDGCMVSYVPNDPDSFLFHHLLRRDVDGLLFVGVDLENAGVQLVREKGIPVLLVNHRGTHEVSSVSVAHYTAMGELTDHLLQVHGYRNIFYLKGTPTSYTTERLQGALDRAKRYGLSTDDITVIDCRHGVERALDPIMQALPDLEAVIVDNGGYAIDLVPLLTERGIKIPDDLALVCFDDLSISAKLEPPLTTIAFDAYELGRRAAEELLKVIRGEHITIHIELPYELKIRVSCGCHSRKAR